MFCFSHCISYWLLTRCFAVVPFIRVHFSSKIVSDEHTGNLDIIDTLHRQPRQRPWKGLCHPTWCKLIINPPPPSRCEPPSHSYPRAATPKTFRLHSNNPPHAGHYMNSQQHTTQLPRNSINNNTHTRPVHPHKQGHLVPPPPLPPPHPQTQIPPRHPRRAKHTPGGRPTTSESAPHRHP
jgi:hypothetical protein